MRKTSRIALTLFLTLGVAGGVAVARDVTSLHIEVREGEGEAPKVRIQFPIELLQAAADSIHGEHFGPAGVLDELHREGFDLRGFWRQVRERNINDFLTVEIEDASIRAWREGGLFRLRVEADDAGEHFGRFHGTTHVDVRIPEEIMDLLVEGGDWTTPADLVEALRRHGPMTLVEVQSDDESVRIWLE